MIESQVVVKDCQSSVGEGHCRHDLVPAPGGVGLHILRRIVYHDRWSPVRAIDGAGGDNAGIATRPETASRESQVNESKHVRGDGRIGIGAERGAGCALIEWLKRRDLYRRAEGSPRIARLRYHDGVRHTRGGKLTPRYVDVAVHGIDGDRAALAGSCSTVDLNRSAPRHTAIGRARKH